MIVIGVWRGCSERALQNKSIAEIEQLREEARALVKGIEDEIASERAVEAKLMEDIRAADTKRFLAERAAQDEAAKVRAELDAAKQRLYDLRDKIGRKVNIWNEGVESDWNVYRDAIDEIEYKARAEYDAVWKARDEAEARVRAELKEVDKKWSAKLRVTPDGDKWDAMYRAKRHAMRRAEKEARAKLAEIEVKGDAEREAVKARVRLKVEGEAAKTRYTLTEFYNIFGKPDYWRPTANGAYCYYEYKETIVWLALSDDHYRGDDAYGFFNPVHIDGVDKAHSIPISLRLARKGSFKPLKDKTLPKITELVSDWNFSNIQSRREGASSKQTIEAFYGVFGEPKYLKVYRDYYSFYYECKVRRKKHDEWGRLKVGVGELRDGITELKISRRDFDERETVNVEIGGVYEPSKLADSIKNLELKAKGRRSGQFTGVEQKTGD